MAQLFSNNYSTTLNGAISNSATTITVTSTTNLPAIGGGDTCLLTIDDGTNVEIVSATAVSGFVLTVVRGQEGTSGTVFADGTPIALRATAASFDVVEDLNNASAVTVATDDKVLIKDTSNSDKIEHVTAQSIADLHVKDWELISTATASASSSIDFTTGIDSTYSAFFIVVNNITPATDGTALYMRTSIDGGSTWDSTSGDYVRSTIYYNSSGGAGTANAFGSSTETFVNLGGPIGSASGEGVSGTVIGSNLSSTTKYASFVSASCGITNAGDVLVSNNSFIRQSTSAVNGLRFLFSSGNIASGTISLYGIRGI